MLTRIFTNLQMGLCGWHSLPLIFTFDGHVQVLLWDTRAKSFPAQRTRLVAGGGHTYPVYSLKIVGE